MGRSLGLERRGGGEEEGKREEKGSVSFLQSYRHGCFYASRKSMRAGAKTRRLTPRREGDPSFAHLEEGREGRRGQRGETGERTKDEAEATLIALWRTMKNLPFSVNIMKTCMRSSAIV